MLPKKRRIPKVLFSDSARGGFRILGKYFSATISQGARGTEIRCAVVVSGKVSKKATVRNKIRRRAYEAIAREGTPIPREKNLHVILYARAEARSALFQNIQSDIKRIMEKAGEKAT